jgi:hypothetical protein
LLFIRERGGGVAIATMVSCVEKDIALDARFRSATSAPRS